MPRGKGKEGEKRRHVGSRGEGNEGARVGWGQGLVQHNLLLFSRFPETSYLSYFFCFYLSLLFVFFYFLSFVACIILLLFTFLIFFLSFLYILPQPSFCYACNHPLFHLFSLPISLIHFLVSVLFVHILFFSFLL